MPDTSAPCAICGTPATPEDLAASLAVWYLGHFYCRVCTARIRAGLAAPLPTPGPHPAPALPVPAPAPAASGSPPPAAPPVDWLAGIKAPTGADAPPPAPDWARAADALTAEAARPPVPPGSASTASSSGRAAKKSTSDRQLVVPPPAPTAGGSDRLRASSDRLPKAGAHASDRARTAADPPTNRPGSASERSKRVSERLSAVPSTGDRGGRSTATPALPALIIGGLALLVATFLAAYSLGKHQGARPDQASASLGVETPRPAVGPRPTEPPVGLRAAGTPAVDPEADALRVLGLRSTQVSDLPALAAVFRAFAEANGASTHSAGATQIAGLLADATGSTTRAVRDALGAEAEASLRDRRYARAIAIAESVASAVPPEDQSYWRDLAAAAQARAELDLQQALTEAESLASAGRPGEAAARLLEAAPRFVGTCAEDRVLRRLQELVARVQPRETPQPTEIAEAPTTASPRPAAGTPAPATAPPGERRGPPALEPGSSNPPTPARTPPSTPASHPPPRHESPRERAARLEGERQSDGWDLALPTEHYDILSDAPREKTIEFGQIVEAMFAAFVRIFDYDGEIQSPLVIHIYGSYDDFLTATGMPPGVGGFYDYEKIVAFWDRTWHPLTTMRTLLHEGTHQFQDLVLSDMRGVSAGNGTWLLEGLATYFEWSEFEDGQLTMGGVNYDRVRALKRAIQADDYIPLEQLLRTPQAMFGLAHYEHAWGFIHFLVHAGNGELRPRFLQVWRRVQAGGDASEALLQAFPDYSLSQLEQAWKAYILSLE